MEKNESLNLPEEAAFAAKDWAGALEQYEKRPDDPEAKFRAALCRGYLAGSAQDAPRVADEFARMDAVLAAREDAAALRRGYARELAGFAAQVSPLTEKMPDRVCRCTQPSGPAFEEYRRALHTLRALYRCVPYELLAEREALVVMAYRLAACGEKKFRCPQGTRTHTLRLPVSLRDEADRLRDDCVKEYVQICTRREFPDMEQTQRDALCAQRYQAEKHRMTAANVEMAQMRNLALWIAIPTTLVCAFFIAYYGWVEFGLGWLTWLLLPILCARPMAHKAGAKHLRCGDTVAKET
ncbi:MAG: hypothetical protein PHD32_00580 [Eubacteriales bacterium]|nr:hypothetical protein [Eubacteriales bacterium]